MFRMIFLGWASRENTDNRHSRSSLLGSSMDGPALGVPGRRLIDLFSSAAFLVDYVEFLFSLLPQDL